DRPLRDRRREVARPDLSRAGVEPLELRLRQADDDLAVEDADRRGHRACGAHLPFRLEPDLDALAGREAVRDERRLERDDRARLAHLICDPQHAARLLASSYFFGSFVIGLPDGARTYHSPM